MRKEKRASKVEPTKAETARISPRAWALALLFCVTSLAFANTVFFDFAFDDQSQILSNDQIKDLSNLPQAFTTEVWFFEASRDHDPNEKSEATTPYYRPVFTVYLTVCWAMFENNPALWHIFNILAHLLIVYLAFLILEKITDDIRLSTIGALIFAIHPLRSESVAWISGISDPLLAIFVLGSFYLYLLYRREGKAKYFVGAIALYFIATLAKEPALALPIFIAAYELLVINEDLSLFARARKLILPAVAMGALSIVYFALRYNALGFVLNNRRFAVYSTEQVLLTIPLAIWKYIQLLFLPFNLTLFHNTPVVKSPLELRFILPALGLVALGAGLWKLRHSRLVRFGALWFFIHLIPVLNLNAFKEDFLIQERYAYIPSIGFGLLIAMALTRAVERFSEMRSRLKTQIAATSLLALLLLVATVAQNQVWKDDMTLWEYGITAAPEDDLPFFILGHKYLNTKDYQKVVDNLEECLKRKPDNVLVMSNLAGAHLFVYERTRNRAHIDRAIALCEKGVKIDATIPMLWDHLGRAYTYDTELKNLDRALYFFSRALALNPENGGFNFHMGAACVKAGKQELALEYLKKAREQTPDFSDIYLFTAYAHHNRGDFRAAIDSYNEYLLKRPDAPDAAKIRQDMDKLRAQLQSASLQNHSSQNKAQSN
jgi:tetratricopeptide (TPR) repeat protein